MFNISEVDKNAKYYKFAELNKPYNNGKSFETGKILIADSPVDLQATEISKIGGFCISDYEHIFRWVIRGSYLCEVKIPEDSRIYKTESENGVYVANRIILTNPIKMSDELATKLYEHSNLSEISYFRAMAACTIQGYINTAKKVFDEQINKNNIGIAISEFKLFCKRREEEYNVEVFNLDNVKFILDKFNNFKKN